MDQVGPGIETRLAELNQRLRGEPKRMVNGGFLALFGACLGQRDLKQPFLRPDEVRS